MQLRGDRVDFFNNNAGGYSSLLVEQIQLGPNSVIRIGFNSSGNILHYIGGTMRAIIDEVGFGVRWSKIRDDAFDSYQRTTAITYTAEVVDPPAEAFTTITGNLVVTGIINGQTISGSHTITHITKSIDITLEEGIFVETTGKIYKEQPPTKYVKHIEIKTRPTPEPIEKATYDENGNKLTDDVYGVEEYEVITFIPEIAEELNPYENCICKIKRAQTLNKNIVGVLTSVNPVKFATHGDTLIKVINDSSIGRGTRSKFATQLTRGFVTVFECLGLGG